jgi:hypothetical protein
VHHEPDTGPLLRSWVGFLRRIPGLQRVI